MNVNRPGISEGDRGIGRDPFASPPRPCYIARRLTHHEGAMKQIAAPILVALLAAGCAQSAHGPSMHAEVPRPLFEPPAEPEPPPPPEAHAAAAAINVIGTPIYAPLKAGVCISSFALAVPLAALIGLTDRPDKRDWQDGLAQGVGQNCGGSYVLGG